MNRYYVAFEWVEKKFGSRTLSWKITDTVHNLLYSEDLQKYIEELREKLDAHEVVLLNWKLLEE